MRMLSVQNTEERMISVRPHLAVWQVLRKLGERALL